MRKRKQLWEGPPPARRDDTWADVARRWSEWLKLDREELTRTPRTHWRYRQLQSSIALDAKMLNWARRHLKQGEESAA